MVMMMTMTIAMAMAMVVMMVVMVTVMMHVCSHNSVVAVECTVDPAMIFVLILSQESTDRHVAYNVVFISYVWICCHC